MELINLFIEDSLEDKSGVSAIALVDSPAIEIGWTAFASQSEKPKLKKYTIQLGAQKGDLIPVEGEEQMLFGAFMIADMRIPRIDPETGKKFDCIFTTQMVKRISEKWALSNFNTNLNEMHNGTMPVKGGVVQHFLINTKNGISPPFGHKLKDGDWAGYIKVLDKNKWDTFIKTGIYTGFSVEGFFYEESVSSLTEAEESLFNQLINSELENKMPNG